MRRIVAHGFVPFDALEDVRHAFRVPPSAALRGNAARFERLGDRPKRFRAGRLRRSDGGSDVRGERVRAGPVAGVGGNPGLGELGIAEDLSAGLGGRQGGPGAARDQGALFFRQSGIEMQDERLDVRPQFRDDEGARDAPSIRK